jgi:23S rRNA (uracil1939-C5)-methyltransferase
MNDTVTISRIGHQGDGIGEINGKPVFVPYSLVGEEIIVSGSNARKEIISISQTSPNRVSPFCDYFGTCGGCLLQHLDEKTYRDWKLGLLLEAFSREGLAITPEPMAGYDKTNRRRAILTAKVSPNGLLLGFSEKGSNDLININSCPILVPELNAVLGDAGELTKILFPKNGEVRISLLLCENGVDIAFTSKGKLSESLIRELITHTSARVFIRLSVNGEIVVESQKPLLKIGMAIVTPPPEAFIQAVEDAEKDMAMLVTGHLKKCKKVADLFSGFGTFALRLAENSQVYAAESSEAALAAMDRGWRETGGKLKALTHEKRDLFRRPMNVKDLKYFDGAVFDPPRAGAEAQARELAKSPVRKIAAVSCNPQTLARDVKLLVDGGFKIKSVTPIDQFAYTPHLEAVVLLER